MSKDSFASGELLGFIRFVFDRTKSRNLNATQAYDDSTTQIVLAKYKATATRKSPAKSLGVEVRKKPSVHKGALSVTLTGLPGGNLAAETNSLKGGRAGKASTSTISTTFKVTSVISASEKITYLSSQASVANFTGAYEDAIARSETQDIFYGAINVGTGEYREWQGKYAVLKIDLVTNNAILRVYND